MRVEKIKMNQFNAQDNNQQVTEDPIKRAEQWIAEKEKELEEAKEVFKDLFED